MAWHRVSFLREAASGKAKLWQTDDYREIWLPVKGCPTRAVPNPGDEGWEEIWVPAWLEKDKELTPKSAQQPAFILPQAYACLQQIDQYLTKYLATGESTPMDAIWLQGLVKEALDNRRI